MKYWKQSFIRSALVTAAVLKYVLPKERYTKTSHILDMLTDKSRYDKRLRPLHGGKAVNASVSLLVSSFGKLREIEMDLSLDVFIRHYWNDPRLKHNLDDEIVFNGDDLQAIWLPDTYFLNVKTITKHKSFTENSGIRINRNGDVTFSLRMTLTISCHMDFHFYPVDEQICNLTISSYSFDSNRVEYNWKLDPDGKPMIEFLSKELAEFSLEHIKVSKQYTYYTGWNKVPLAEVSVVLYLRRRLQFALVQIFLPTFLIVALSWLTFWVEKDAVPARLGLGVTTVLTMVTLMGSFRSALPKVSYIKAVDIYFIVSLLFVFFAVFEYVAVLLHSGLEEQKRKRLSQLREKNTQIHHEDNQETACSRDDCQREKVNTETEENLRLYVNEKRNGKRLRAPFKGTVKKTKSVMVFAFVKNDADVIDRVCRYTVPGIYFAFNTGFILYFQLANIS